MIAFCAVLISAASFYATYLQADSAEKQVKAMTFPLLYFDHGNINEKDEKEVILSVVNAGIGPAMIKSVTVAYQGKKYSHFYPILERCCSEKLLSYIELMKAQAVRELPQFSTSPVNNSVLAGQSTLDFFRFKYHPENEQLWEQINEVRFNVKYSACYCSMLGDCFETSERHQLKPVASCQ